MRTDVIPTSAKRAPLMVDGPQTADPRTDKAAHEVAVGGPPSLAHSTLSAPGVPSSGTADESGLGAGTVLAERYRLVRPVGRGGMGWVWEGEHLALKTPVAIKLINPSLIDNESARARFLREARSAAGLRSPHVVQIFDYGVHGDTPYIAMELLSGESLAARLDRDRALSPAETRRLLTPVFKAMAKAHGAGLVHRDLKPDNIFLVDGDDDTSAKVLDFGVVKGVSGGTLDASTQMGSMLGTPYYMSPEQLIGANDLDARADLWALAVIAYQCLVGARPFQEDSVPGLAVAILAESPPVPSRHAEVPTGFDDWFARATTRDIDARFQSATEMLASLREALDTEVVVPTLTPPEVPTPSRDRSHKLLWVIAAFAVGGAAAVVVERPGPSRAQVVPPAATADATNETPAAVPKTLALPTKDAPPPPVEVAEQPAPPPTEDAVAPPVAKPGPVRDPKPAEPTKSRKRRPKPAAAPTKGKADDGARYDPDDLEW